MSDTAFRQRRPAVWLVAAVPPLLFGPALGLHVIIFSRFTFRVSPRYHRWLLFVTFVYPRSARV
jgi:hypothetical protein